MLEEMGPWKFFDKLVKLMKNPQYPAINTEIRKNVCKSMDDLCARPREKLENYGFLKQKRKEAIDLICEIEDLFLYMDSDDYNNEQLDA